MAPHHQPPRHPMNCKPGQMAIIVRSAKAHSCCAQKIGAPVQVSQLLQPTSWVLDALVMIEGPIWMLASPLSCPHRDSPCPTGFEWVPDACLKPIDGTGLDAEERSTLATPVQGEEHGVAHG